MWTDTRLGRWHQRWKFRRFKKVFGVGAVHSLITPFTFNDLMIVPLPMGISNYSYLVADIAVGNQVLIDVGDATELQYLTSQPDAILTTHKHWDHSGGNKTMRRTFPKLKIYGSQMDGVPDRTHDVKDGDVLSFGRLKFTAMETPGHTHGHVMWRLHGDVFSTRENLFTGDQLWVAGRGIAHEGTNVDMLRSMKSLKELPLNTLIWPGHEHALYGLSRALHLEPRNKACIIKWNRVVKLRRAKLGTCPTTLAEEMAYNPNLRTDNEAFWASLLIQELVANECHGQEDVDRLCLRRMFWAEMNLHAEFKKAHRERKKKSTKEIAPAQQATEKTENAEESRNHEEAETSKKDKKKNRWFGCFMRKKKVHKEKQTDKLDPREMERQEEVLSVEKRENPSSNQEETLHLSDIEPKEDVPTSRQHKKVSNSRKRKGSKYKHIKEKRDVVFEVFPKQSKIYKLKKAADHKHKHGREDPHRALLKFGKAEIFENEDVKDGQTKEVEMNRASLKGASSEDFGKEESKKRQNKLWHLVLMKTIGHAHNSELLENEEDENEIDKMPKYETCNCKKRESEHSKAEIKNGTTEKKHARDKEKRHHGEKSLLTKRLTEADIYDMLEVPENSMMTTAVLMMDHFLFVHHLTNYPTTRMTLRHGH